MQPFSLGNTRHLKAPPIKTLLIKTLFAALGLLSASAQADYYAGFAVGGGRMTFDNVNEIFPHDGTRESRLGVFGGQAFIGMGLESGHNVRVKLTTAQTDNFLGFNDTANLDTLGVDYFYEIPLGEHFALAPGVGLSHWTLTTDDGSDSLQGINQRRELDESGMNLNYSLQFIWRMSRLVQLGLVVENQAFDRGGLQQTLLSARFNF